MAGEGSQNSGGKWAHLAIALGGAVLGAAWTQSRIADSKKSLAEQEYPEEVAQVCEEIAEILDDWELDPDSDLEDDFTDDLADFLEVNTDWEIFVRPQTDEGSPDILIDDLLALELKVSPSKVELDRCIGQCAGYSRAWVTWMVLIDVDADALDRLESILEDKGLEQIGVWNFP